VAVLLGAIVVRMTEAVLYTGLGEAEGLVAVAVDLVLRLTGGEAEDVENWSAAAVVALKEAVHYSGACLYGSCPGLRVWAAVEGGCRRYLVVGTIDMAVGSFETGGAETTVRCNSLLEMSF
jgi:hypothetical protein